jgi:uncharacterized protein (TIGR02246 family)
MKPRTCLLSVFILATAVAFGAEAQQTSKQDDVWQAGDLVVQAHNKAMQARDAAGVAALYSEDVIFLTPDGPVYGRAGVEKFCAGIFKVLVTMEPAKLDKAIMVGDALRLRTGSYSAVIQSPNGPMPVKGYWSTTDMREGNTWKIRMETDNVTMPPPPAEPKK